MSTSTHPARQLIGRVLLAYDMPIERGKIREFATATANAHPIYQGSNPPVPPTFLTTSMHWEPRQLVPMLQLDLHRVLQGGQEYRFLGTVPRAGDELHVQTCVESVSDKHGGRGGLMTFIVVLTTFFRSDGTVAAEGRATIIERAPL